MSDPGQMRSTALTLGIVGLLLIGTGVGIVLFSGPDTSSASSGVFIRTGAILGAVALVLPSLKKPSVSVIVIAGGGLLLVLARPSLIWVALTGWIVWLIFGRQRRTANRES